ncbi:hypothetical protein GQ600_24305 [Phytophthora cactorum]|nr:hypothetical protein GQ600_24305 [Phytophthora cactorum]
MLSLKSISPTPTNSTDLRVM